MKLKEIFENTPNDQELGKKLRDMQDYIISLEEDNTEEYQCKDRFKAIWFLDENPLNKK